MGADQESGRIGPRTLRLAMLYSALVDSPAQTAAALAEATGSGVRTVYRDIGRLRDAGLEISGTPRVGYELMNEPELAPLFLAKSERAALLAVAPATLKSKLRAL